MAASNNRPADLTQVSAKLDTVLGHVQVIPELQSDLKLFKMDVAVLQLDMAATNSTLRQHGALLGEHSVAIGNLRRDIDYLKGHR